MIEILREFETFRDMAILTSVGHFCTVRVGVTGLAVRVFIGCRHVFENLIHMARRASDFPMLSSQPEIGIPIVIELNPRKRGCDVAE